MRGRRTSWRRLLVVALLWNLVGLSTILRGLDADPGSGAAYPWARLAWYMIDWNLYLLLLTPLILELVRRAPIQGSRWLRSSLVHIAGAVAVSLASLLMTASLKTVVPAYSGSHKEAAGPGVAPAEAPPTFGEVYRRLLNRELTFNLTLYGIFALGGHALRFVDQARAHELAASQLEASLSHARLEALRLQLQPHFLFNALNAVTALIHRDPEAAEHTVDRLSELLRHLLNQKGQQEVSLEEELAFARGYLDIEQTRIGDRLAVAFDVAPETLSCRVPSLLLQPLVENAVRHGIARSKEPGRLSVRILRREDRLEILIANTGPGLEERPPSPRQGLGLFATRARLQRLYGEDHRFALTDGPEGGVQVTVQLPFQPLPSAA